MSELPCRSRHRYRYMLAGLRRGLTGAKMYVMSFTVATGHVAVD